MKVALINYVDKYSNGSEANGYLAKIVEESISEQEVAWMNQNLAEYQKRNEGRYYIESIDTVQQLPTVKST